MTTLLTIDSSVYLSTLSEEDSRCEPTKVFFDFSASSDFHAIIPTLVVCEVMNVLFQMHREQYVAPTLDLLERHSWVELTSAEARAMQMIFSLFRLKTSDAIVAGTAYRYRTTLISWDERLLRESRKHLPSFTPSEFMRKIRP